MDVRTEVRAGLTTFMVMAFTWSISNGIGVGFASYVAIKLLNGKAGQVHPLMHAVAAAFVLYFASPLIERRLP